MSQLRQVGIGGLPGCQEVRVPGHGRRGIASLLAGQRNAVEREAGARALDERVLVRRFSGDPVRSTEEGGRFGLANRPDVGGGLAVAERFFFLRGLDVKLFRVVVELLLYRQTGAQFKRHDG
jgi:hypothetical protein